MKVVGKAVAAVVRQVEGGHELLVFTQPDPLAGVQIPKGTMEPGETIAQATLRELEEESGLRLGGPPNRIGTWERLVGGGPREDGPPELHPWHLSLLEAPPGLPDSWRHHATGSPVEEGLIFEFHWVAINAELPARLHPVFGVVSRMLLEHFGS